LDSLPEVLDVQERVLRINDLLVDEEVDRDRRVVLGDASLLRDLHHELPQIHGLRDALDRGRQKQHDARSGDLLEAPEPEHDAALATGSGRRATRSATPKKIAVSPTTNTAMSGSTVCRTPGKVGRNGGNRMTRPISSETIPPTVSSPCAGTLISSTNSTIAKT